MKVLVDVVHPAHVHFYRYIIEVLRDRGDHVRIVSRRKDVTVELLDDFGLDHEILTDASGGSRLGQAEELIRRDWALWQLAREFGPDVVLTRNPSGIHAARLVGAVGIFDTDDGPQAGLLWKAAAPFAHVITTPAALGKLHPRQRTYAAYKATAYLHPRHRRRATTPIRAQLGFEPSQQYSVLRLVGMGAVHDHGEQGLQLRVVTDVLDVLLGRGPVLVTSESPLPAGLARHALPLPASSFHDAMADASIVVGDSITVAIEAALLGTPAVHMSSFVGRRDVLSDIEARYGVVKSFRPNEPSRMLSVVTEWSAGHKQSRAFRSGHRRLMDDQVDVVEWYVALLDEVVSG